MCSSDLPIQGPRHRHSGLTRFLPSPASPSVDVEPWSERPTSNRALGGDSSVTYVDRPINCVDCGVEFIHSAADQEFYAQKGFVSDPKRCTSCRASRRAAGVDRKSVV